MNTFKLTLWPWKRKRCVVQTETSAIQFMLIKKTTTNKQTAFRSSAAK